MLIQLYYTISSVSDIIELSDVMPDTATKELPQIGIPDKLRSYQIHGNVKKKKRKKEKEKKRNNNDISFSGGEERH